MTVERDFSVYALDPNISERDFLEHVRMLAKQGGWLYYHTHDSRHSASGFFDCVMVRDTMILAELKTRTGRLTDAQNEWVLRTRLATAGTMNRIEVHIWRPENFEEIARRLLRGVPL